MIQPGIYDFSNDDYHKSEGISRSGIMLLKKSELHYWDRYINPNKKPEKESKAKEFGAAFHPYIIEPELFDMHFAAHKEKVNLTTKKGKEYDKKFREENPGKTILKIEEFEALKGMAIAINEDPIAKDLVLGAQYEKSIYWVDPATEILCKCRPDILFPNMIVDLKSAANGSKRAFENAVWEYGYYIQAAMMREASRHILEKDIEDFIFLVIEKTPPYARGIYPLGKEAIDKGKEDFMVALLKYKKCLKENSWPSYGIQAVSLPRWALTTSQ